MPEAFAASSERPGFFTDLSQQRRPDWLEIILDEPTLEMYRIAASGTP